jgi:hypothetical protein
MMWLFGDSQIHQSHGKIHGNEQRESHHGHGRFFSG